MRFPSRTVAALAGSAVVAWACSAASPRTPSGVSGVSGADGVRGLDASPNPGPSPSPTPSPCPYGKGTLDTTPPHLSGHLMIRSGPSAGAVV